MFNTTKKPIPNPYLEIDEFLNHHGYTDLLFHQHGYTKNNYNDWDIFSDELLESTEDIKFKKTSEEQVLSKLESLNFISLSKGKNKNFFQQKSTNTKKATPEMVNAQFCDSFNKNLKLISQKINPTLKMKPVDRSKKRSGNEKRILNLMLSDLHFHSLLDSKEVPIKYGSVEEARRLSTIIKSTCDFKTQYRDQTTLYVHLLGDIIQNQLHDARDGAPLAEQTAAALYLLSQALQILSENFLDIKVFCTSGNHGRNTARHTGRAITQKWDSVESILYYSLKMACGQLTNVTFDIGYRPYYDCPIFNHWGFFTHGDTVINPGNPSKTINVVNMRKQINEINATAQHGKKYSLFGVGHIHTASQTHLPGACTLITNGALVPPDSYAVSLGIFDSTCGQWLFESTEKYVFGDSRLIIVGQEDDNNLQLDNWIKPFQEF